MIEEVIFTACPNGRSRNLSQLQLSVFVAPHLSDAGTGLKLGGFPMFADWPSVMPRSFELVINGAPSGIIASSSLTDENIALMSRRWAAVFTPSAPVTPSSLSGVQFMHDRTFVAAPADRILDHLTGVDSGLHVDVAADPATAQELPLYSAVQAKLAPLVRAFDTSSPARASALDTIGSQITAEQAPSRSLPSTPDIDFLLHERALPRVHQPATQPHPDPPAYSPPDFHQVVSMLGSHPALLRALGLVIDLTVDLSGFGPVGQTRNVLLRVSPVWPDGAPAPTARVIMPATATLIGTATLEAALNEGPLSGDVANGALRLADSDAFYVRGVDPDRAAFSARDLAAQLRDEPADSSRAVPMPTLSTTGFGIYHVDRAKKFVDTQAALKTHRDEIVADTDEFGLDATDLMRGYRLDVWHIPRNGQPANWYSLNRRAGTYRIGDQGAAAAEDLNLVVEHDEGIVSPTPASIVGADGAASGDVHLPERLLRWEGWSLVTRRPGGIVSSDTTSSNPAHGGAPVDDAVTPGIPTGFGLQLDVNRALGLPRLRYGDMYQFKVRTVDLAGNSIHPNRSTPPPTDPTVSRPVRFGRFRPVAAPVMVTTAPLAPKATSQSVATAPGGAETQDRLVVRSEDPSDRRLHDSVRHVAPPATSQHEAELHGMFDTNNALDIGAYSAITHRDGRTFYDEQLAGYTGPAGVKDPDHSDTIRYYAGSDLPVPYLPDPVSSKAIFRGLPGGEFLTSVPFRGSWPDLGTFRLVVTKAAPGSPASVTTVPADPEASPTQSARLVVALPAGERYQVGMSSGFDLPHEFFGMWELLARRFRDDPDTLELLRELVDTGQHQQFTPRRIVSLVHATRVPATTTEYDLTKPFGAVRSFVGATTAALLGTLTYHRPSTSRIELLATWSDPIDTGPGGPDPTVLHLYSARPFNVHLDADAPGSPLATMTIEPAHGVGPQHDFGDTKVHRVKYMPIATSAYAEEFRQTQLIDKTHGSSTALDTGGKALVPGSLIVRSVVVNGRGHPFTEGVDYAVDVVKTATSTTTSVRILPGAFLGNLDTEASFVIGPITLDGAAAPAVIVKSTTAPAPPKPLYVVPAFKFETTQRQTATSSRRLPGGLRIYLERPWWSSGQGELLGVVVRQPDRSFSSDLMTHVGPDPIVPTTLGGGGSDDPVPYPVAGDFGAFERIGTDLLVPGFGDRAVDVVGYRVAFDAVRDRWFADVQISSERGYFPFARLALVRYQPNSFDPQHSLSPLMMTDFVQLSPERNLTITRNKSAGRTTIDVHIIGESYRVIGTDVLRPPARMKLTIESRSATVKDDTMGWVEEATYEIPFLSQAHPEEGEQTIWTRAGIKLPVTPGTYRAVLEEFEYVTRDSDVPEQSPSNQDFAPYVDTATGQRLIHTDIIAL